MTKEERKAQMRAWNEANKEKRRAYREAHKEERKAYYEAHKKEQAVAMKIWYEDHKEEQRTKHRIYGEAHKEEQREYQKLYRKINPEKRAAGHAKNRAKRLKATPLWLTEEHHEDILSKYKESQILTESTGIPHHVDHIIPLQGKNVRGLHVPWNLQVITAEENMKKGNRINQKKNK